MVEEIKPHHCQLTREDAEQRVFIIPGSNGRAKYIADNFLDKVRVNSSSRGHDVYLGNIPETDIRVGVVSTGMGCPSVDILVTELIAMGVKTLIRIGTAGGFDLQKTPLGSVVIACSGVRDEGTSSLYTPLEVPAIADRNLVNYLENSAKNLNIKHRVGIVHTKDSLMVREFKLGHYGYKSNIYMEGLKKMGVLASEMESSHLFILGMNYDVKTASVLSIIGGEDIPFSDLEKLNKQAIDNCIKITLDTINTNYLSLI